MEEQFLKILAELKVPSTFISILLLLSRLSPITFVTAHEVERKIYTKEKRLTFSVIHYIFNMFIVTLFMFFAADFLSSNPNLYNGYFALVITILTLLCFAFIFWLSENGMKLKHAPAGSKKRVLLVIAVIIYCITCTFMPSYYVGTQVLAELKDNNNNNNLLEYMLGTMLAFFPISGLVLLLLRPIVNIFEFSTKKAVSIEIMNQGQPTKWFLLYPIQTEEYLLGDHYIPSLCSKTRVIKKEELFQKEFIIEKLENNTVPS